MRIKQKMLEKLRKVNLSILIAITFIVFLSLFLTECKQKKKVQISSKEKNINMDTITTQIFIKQIEDGCDETYGSFLNYGEDDLAAAARILSDTLKRKGYSINHDIFSSKIENIFGRIIDWNSERKYLSVKYYNPCDKVIEYKPIFSVYYNHIYISKEYCLILDFYPLPMLIDYTIYPQIFQYEKDKKIIYDAIEDSNIEIAQWKDIKLELDNKRNNLYETTFHRNKYLFNSSQASLTWLINNDAQFLESLVKTFGYVQDKKLLKWVIDRNRFEFDSGKTNGAEYSKILWSRDCSGRLNFHKETLVVMKENLTANSPIYLYDLLNYIDYLTEKKESQEELSLSFEEKAHIIGNILYFVQSMAKEKGYEQFEFRAMGRFYEFHDHKNEYDNEFLKKNYYELVGFKEMWEQAKEDGDGMTYYIIQENTDDDD